MLKNKTNDQHEFALYWADLVAAGHTSIVDPVLVHRIAKVLRLADGDTCILFNEKIHARTTIHACGKRVIQVHVGVIKENTCISPTIYWLLPLLDRAAFDEACRMLMVMGATAIYPVITAKSRQRWQGERERERLKRIFISAAEQSKQFAFPALHEPIMLADAIKVNESRHIFFDPSGESLLPVLQDAQLDYKPLSLLIGPEGDLTHYEKSTLHDKQVTFCHLTPTILRAEHAVMVSMGIVRSLLKY